MEFLAADVQCRPPTALPIELCSITQQSERRNELFERRRGHIRLAKVISNGLAFGLRVGSNGRMEDQQNGRG